MSEQLTIADYEAAFADHRALVRRLDVALNGEAGAAKQASLCDIVGQIEDRHWALVPREPTEAMWGGLARDMVMWTRFGIHTGADLHKHLRMLGKEVPAWLLEEIPDTNVVPPKGTVAACIYKAMLAEI